MITVIATEETFIYIYIYIERERERETEISARERERKTCERDRELDVYVMCRNSTGITNILPDNNDFLFDCTNTS